jgi:predicted HAD superfamily Cof-like phosphohydrolase
MEEPQALNSVAEFHRTFKHPIQEQAKMPAKERAALRVSLLAEELKELQQAIDDNDMVEVADALCDLQYVLSGAILEFGLGEKFKALFDEVHRSNMSKACKTVDEANQTIAHYLAKDNVEAHYKELDGLYLVYRTVDNKTLKSIAYSPAGIKAMMEV